MSLNNVIAFVLLFKKMTKKTTVSKKKQEMPRFIQKEDAIIQHNQDFNTVDKRASSIISSLTTPIVFNSSNEKIIQHHPIKPKDIKIRDFAYPLDSPLHFGNKPVDNQSNISLSSPEFNGRDAKVLFDFTPETEYEVELKAGQIIWVQYRQCPGWLIADVQDETGLIPESYVEFI